MEPNGEVFRSVIWRGTPLSEQHVKPQYRYTGDEVSRVRKNLINVPDFVSVNWTRYFAFLEKKNGRQLVWYDAALIGIGTLTWKAWYMLRVLAKKIRITQTVYRLFR